jgi:hypothetical protein
MHPTDKPSGLRRAGKILLIIIVILITVALTRHFTLNGFTFNPHAQ